MLWHGAGCAGCMRRWGTWSFVIPHLISAIVKIISPNELKLHYNVQVVSSFKRLAAAWVDGGVSLISCDEQRWLACPSLIYRLWVTDQKPEGLAQAPLPRAQPRTSLTLHNLPTGPSGKQHASARQLVKGTFSVILVDRFNQSFIH